MVIWLYGYMVIWLYGYMVETNDKYLSASVVSIRAAFYWFMNIVTVYC